MATWKSVCNPLSSLLTTRISFWQRLSFLSRTLKGEELFSHHLWRKKQVYLQVSRVLSRALRCGLQSSLKESLGASQKDNRGRHLAYRDTVRVLKMMSTYLRISKHFSEKYRLDQFVIPAFCHELCFEYVHDRIVSHLKDVLGCSF